jgi:outer membrane protein insertion porin family
MMRASYRRFCISLAALAAALAAVAPSSALAQGGYGGGPGGGMGAMPSTIFKPKKDSERAVSGPSLTATDELVAEIRIVGNKTITATQVLNQLETRANRPFDPALVQRDVRTLTNRGWFIDVKPEYEQAPGGRVVIFNVVERPVIRYIQYLGNEGIRDKKLRKEADLQMGGPVDPYMVEEARKKILDLYRKNGFNNAQVTILEGSKPTDQGVVFAIDEGTKQRIWRVTFEGADFVSNRRLKTQIESKPPLMYMFKGYLDRDQLDADVDRLTAYYRAFGFFQARVGRVVEMNDNDTWATLRFVVHEGPRYQVEDVSFIGNKVFANESLAMLIKLPPGQPFEQAEMNADLQRLKDLYGSQGYVFADIRAEPIFLEEPGKLRLTYHVEEGKQWRVGRIHVQISGDNPHTRIQTALNRLSIVPGQIVDTSELRASEIRLRRSQLFMNEPARGIAPKITYHIPDSDAEIASNKNEFRGQSPDAGQHANAETQPPSGPPLIAPPGAAMPNSSTFEISPPPGFVDQDDQIDFFLVFDGSKNAGSAPATGNPPAPQRHEVRRPPYEDNDPPPTAEPAARSGTQRQSVYQQLAPRGNTYQQSLPAVRSGVVVRGQSPQPVVSNYGGQMVGATGPDAVPIGSNPYAVYQAAAPAPTPSGLPVVATQYAAPMNGGASGAPVFAPPPLPPPQYGPAQPVGPLQPLPGPPNGQPAQLGPPQMLTPDPNITPVQPGPGSPQLFPAVPIDPFAPKYNDPFVDLNVVVSEAQTGRLMLGVAVNSDAGLIGQILLDEQNFDWTRYPTSWDDVVSGKAWRGAGQRFRLEAAPGTQVQRYIASFTEPYFLDYPIALSTSGSFYTRRYFEYDEERAGGRLSLAYQWTDNDVSAGLSYRGESIEISNIDDTVPDLVDAEGHNALHGFKLTIANDTRDSIFLATQGHLLELAVEQVIGSFEYPRATIDARKYLLITERPDHSGRHVLTAGTQVGFTGSDTPVYERFYAGGFTTLRGWDFRGVSPVFTSGSKNTKVGGDFMWVNTIEYMCPLTADDMMHGVVFTDFGTVQGNVQLEDFRMSVGFGLRVTVPMMGPAPIALDFAWPIHDLDTDETQVFSFFMGFTR